MMAQLQLARNPATVEMMEWAASRPDDVIVLDDLSRQRSWAQFRRQLGAKCSFLKQEGLRPGERLGVLIHNRVEAVEWLLAGVCAGLWVVPVNWHLRAAEVAHVVSDSCMRILIHDGLPDCDLAGNCRQWQLPEDELRFFADIPDTSFAMDDPAGGIMLYTSGTTGAPKGVRRQGPETLGELFGQWRRHGRSVGLDGEGVHLVTGPLYHAAPMLYAIYDLLNGASLVIQPRFDAAEALALIQRFQVSHTHWVPTMFVRALRLANRGDYCLDSLRLVLHGAAPIAAEVKRQLIDWWGPVLVEYWGGSESGAVTRVTAQEWLEHPGTVGRPLAQFDVYAVDAEGKRLPTGETGLLAIAHSSGKAVFSYHNDPDKTARSYIAPGVFTLGDIGRVDDDGYVYLLDRESHTIISGGVNIYPAEIEAVLVAQPEVADVAVFGIPDEEWGERVCAVVELVAGQDAGDGLREQLLERAGRDLAAYKLPREMYFETLPRTDAGKISLRVLRERFR